MKPSKQKELPFADMQGLLRWGYGNLHFARYVLFQFGSSNGARAWLSEVEPDITRAAEAFDADPKENAINVAFTYDGIKMFELNEPTLNTFPSELIEGMTTPHRQRILGDTGKSAPENWEWGWTDNKDPNAPKIHAVLLIYASTSELLDAACKKATHSFAAYNITLIKQMDTAPLARHENFGFRDGISQPVVEGLTDKDEEAKKTMRLQREVKEAKEVKAVQTINEEKKAHCKPPPPIKLGEFCLGYSNAYGKQPLSPHIEASEIKKVIKFKSRGNNDKGDLGLNGSYLVFRQLEQDVPQFWRFMLAQAKTDEEAIRLASKMVGRWPSGAPLVKSLEQDDPAQTRENCFGYKEEDPDGLKCPIGSHIRRTNPRDMLEDTPPQTAQEIVDRHRILRRGRNYGPRFGATANEILAAVQAGTVNLAEKCGLMFICLNANIQRQFEFVQHSWCNNAKFETLYDEVDAISGAPTDEMTATDNHFSLPGEIVRKRVSDVPRFVRVRGGAYFFMPGIQALKTLATKPL